MPSGTFLRGVPPTTLRGIHLLTFSDSMQLGTRTYVSDLGGGASQTWAYATAVPCRVDPLTGREDVVGERLSERSSHQVTAPAGTNVTTDQRIVITGQGTFEVTAVESRTDELACVFEVVEVGTEL